jgi:hypothetical protein
MTTREYPAQAGTAADQHLHKVLGLRALYVTSLGSIVGSGWLFAVRGADGAAGSSVFMARVAGSPGIFCWAVASGHRTAGLAELREAEPAGAGR